MENPIFCWISYIKTVDFQWLVEFSWGFRTSFQAFCLIICPHQIQDMRLHGPCVTEGVFVVHGDPRDGSKKKMKKKTKCEKPRRLYQHLNKGGLRIFWFTYAVLKDSKSLKKEKHPTIIQSKWFLLKGTQDFSLFFSFTSHLPDCSNLAFAKPSQVQREIVRGFRDPHGPDMFKGREEGGVKSGAKNAKKHL